MMARSRAAALVFAVVAALAAVLYFQRLGNVAAPIWDEMYYLPATAHYHEGRTQFASHPPLGMMLIAAGDMASGRNAGADWHRIGANYAVHLEEMPPDFDYTGPRLAPALFGVLAAGIFALLMFELTGSVAAALVLSLLFLADTALMVQIRAAQLDAFQLAFVLGALLAAVHAIRRPGTVSVFLFGFSLACAALVRANALVLGVTALFLLWPALREHDFARLWRRIGAGLLGGLAALVLTLSAYIALSPLPPDPATAAGKADLAFLQPAHRQALETGHWSPAAVLGVMQGIEAHISSDLAITPKSDANGSHPAGWLFGRGAILYRSNPAQGGQMAIGLMPNLVIWLISLFGVLTSLLPSRLRESPVRAMLLAGWIANMAMLQYLDGLRVLYLYHYLIPLLLGHAMAALEWRRMGLPRRGAAVLAGLALAWAALVWPYAMGDVMPPWLCIARLAPCPA